MSENPLPEGKEQECKSVADPENTVSFHHSEINMAKLNVLGRNKSFEGQYKTDSLGTWDFGLVFEIINWASCKNMHFCDPTCNGSVLLSLKAGTCFRDLSLPKSLYLYLNYRCIALGQDKQISLPNVTNLHSLIITKFNFLAIFMVFKHKHLQLLHYLDQHFNT